MRRRFFKILSAGLVLILLFSAVGCEIGSDVDSSETDTEEPSHSQNLQVEFGTPMFYSMTDSFLIYDYEMTEDFQRSVYRDDTAEPTITKTILKTAYEFAYADSIKLELTGKVVHSYRLKDSSRSGGVHIDAESGRIVRCYGIPYDGNPETVSDYLELIDTLVGSECDLSTYDLLIKTRYNKDGWVELDQFHRCNEGEALDYYGFYYRKTVGENLYMETVSAEFSEDSFRLTFIDGQLDNTQFSEISEQWDEYETALVAYLSNVKEKYILSNIDLLRSVLFERDGALWVVTRSDVSFLVPEYEEDGKVPESRVIIGTVTKVGDFVE